MSYEGLRNHVEGKMQKRIDDLKSAKGKAGATEDMQNTLANMEAHKHNWQRYFDMHHHLQQAKHAVMGPLNAADYEHSHSIDGAPSNPEGHVLVINNVPLKLVDRAEFSRKNREKVR